jgi:chaperonin GroEL
MLFNNEARGKLLKGIKSLAEAVSATLGPKGRNVAIKKGDDIHITKDGVTVAKNIKLEDVYEDVGAQMIKEVASKTANIAGDGTTTSVILSSVIFEAGLQLMTAGYNPIDIKKSLEVESKKVIEYLEKISKPVNNDILSIAKISSNDDLEVAQLIADALHEVGENGIVTVEESHNVQTYLEYKKGMQFDRGYISPYFCTNESEQIVEFENPYILTYEGEISNIKDILSILEDVAATKRPLLIICDEISDDVLSTLVINNIKGVIKTAVVKSPMYGDNRKKMVEDIAHITGGVYVDNVVYSLDKIKKDHLGGCSKVIINNEHTTIIDGFCLEDELQSRIDSIVHSISKEKSS